MDNTVNLLISILFKCHVITFLQGIGYSHTQAARWFHQYEIVQSKDLRYYIALLMPILKSHSKSCETCKILIPEITFKNNLTSKEYKTKSWENSNCQSTNFTMVVYVRALGGLIYVSEAEGQFNFRMNDSRSTAM